MQIRFHTFTLIAAAVLALAGLTSVASATESSHALQTPYAAQAKSLGLTAAQADRLQARVQREVQRTGGTQIAVNEVRYDGGATVLTLPGEQIARPLNTDRASSTPPTINRCPYYNFCIYTEQHYKGDMHMLKKCGFYYGTEPWISYVNNQSGHKQARFYDEAGFFDWSRAAISSEPLYPSGPWITSIMPCMK